MVGRKVVGPSVGKPVGKLVGDSEGDVVGDAEGDVVGDVEGTSIATFLHGILDCIFKPLTLISNFWDFRFWTSLATFSTRVL